MVGNAVIFEPALACGFRHYLQRFRTVGRSCVGMEDAVQILVANERGKLFLRRPPDLAPALAQFRRDKLQAEGLVDCLLRRRCHQFPSPVETVRLEIETFFRGVSFELLKMFL